MSCSVFHLNIVIWVQGEGTKKAEKAKYKKRKVMPCNWGRRMRAAREVAEATNLGDGDDNLHQGCQN